MRTPIDINLAKELNILSLDMGLKKIKYLLTQIQAVWDTAWIMVIL
ncbi:MAG: hypothetical protein L6V95_05065 [Candidatus Melainabacteria bacterium]|nr:MAG: hypothetical protein L6V95_05065 [Candidatus Melainabacteria bacterium]